VGIRRHTTLAALWLAPTLLFLAPTAYAFLPDTVVVTPGASVVPGLVTANPGTLVNFFSFPPPFATSDGTTSGTYECVVYRNSGGTIDFYIQLNNSGASTDAIARETNMSFLGFATAVGYRTDGSSLLNPLLVNGTIAPVEADRSPGADVVGFNFQPPAASEILPGEISNVLVISTDATFFSLGNLSIINGGVASGVATVEGYQPATIPEPGTFSFMVVGFVTLLALRRRAP